MFYGIFPLSFWGYFVVTMVLTQITIASVTIYLHRHQSHRALDLHPLVSHFFRFWLWLTTAQVTKQWVAVHRKHHAFSDKPGDPHSPQVDGIWQILFGGVLFYKREAACQETLDKYGHATPDDWIEQHIYTPQATAGPILMLLINLILFGIPGTAIWAIQMLWIPLFAAGVINGLGHYIGYRNFEVPNAARNLYPIAFFIGGEELHNNHHTAPSSAKLSMRWWEFDIGWFYIRCLERVGLAKVKRVAPKAASCAHKQHIDKDTLRAIFATRFQLLAAYRKKVLSPLLAREAQSGTLRQAVSKKIKKLLHRDKALLAPAEAQFIDRALQSLTPQLQTAYQFKLRLQNIWERTAKNQRELIDALQEWCRQAEATGVECLREFAYYIKSYMLAQPQV